MLLPISWLSDFIDLDLDPEALADELTMKGTEVEAIHHCSVSGVVVGRVTTCDPHPDADRLSVCTVEIGAGEPATVVCGAPNVAPGQRVAVAPPGAVLAGGLRVKARKVRGVASAGMILAEDELGIGDDHEGILVLDEDAPIGADLAGLLPICDTVLELSITPNRGDCLSLLGIARELHAATGAPLFLPPMAPADADPAGGELAERLRIEIRDPEGCPRYAARLVAGVRVGPSPLLWRIRLHRAGIRPINAVVDATNITMLELGQPQHGFDLAHFPGGTVTIRPSADQEPFTTLDKVERRLPAGLVMIAAGEQAVAIGGVMGGLDSGVCETTTDVLVESAYFDPGRVRRAASARRIASESSYRFERGGDPERVPDAAGRTAYLIARHAGGRVVPGIVDAYPAPVERPRLSLRRDRLRTLLGIEVPDLDVTRILDRLAMAPRHVAEDGTWSVAVPAHRSDLEREVDLIEEVARIHGYERIPESLGLAGQTPVGPGTMERLAARVEDLLAGIGFSGTCGNSLLGPGDLAACALDAEGAAAPVRLRNPQGEEQSLLRTSLLPSLIACAHRNVARDRPDVRIFELGKVFEDRGGTHRRGDEARFVERELLGLLATGSAEPAHWSGPPRAVDFYDGRGVLEHLLRGLAVTEIEWRAPEQALPYLDPGSSAELLHSGSVLGRVGMLDSALGERFDLSRPVVVAELELEALLALVDERRQYHEPSRFPASRRDLSLVMPPGLDFVAVERQIRGSAKRNLRAIEVFDVYRGKPLDPGQVSIALRLTYRAADRTLTDEEIQKDQDRVIRGLREELGVLVRGADCREGGGTTRRGWDVET